MFYIENIIINICIYLSLFLHLNYYPTKEHKYSTNNFYY